MDNLNLIKYSLQNIKNSKIFFEKNKLNIKFCNEYVIKNNNLEKV